MKKHIPNFITCLNLLCGCLAIVAVLRGDLITASWLVFAAAALDFLDGMVARLLKAYSEIGKQLDSLADMVSFGVVPGMIALHYMRRAVYLKYDSEGIMSVLLEYLPFLLTIFSALRLAKFNIDTRQTNSFIGVPTPANTILWVSFPLILQNDIWGFSGLIEHPLLLSGLILLMSYLLVAEIPLFSLKFKNLKWKDNRIQFIFLICAIPLLGVLFYTAIPIIIFLYVALSIINNWSINRAQE